MQYFLDRDNINIHPLHMPRLGQGKEGSVYSYKNDALKIYHHTPEKRYLDKEMCEYLKRFETKRILLPKALLLDKKGKLQGYATEKIESNDSIYNVDKKKLIEELIEVKKEIKYLSSKYIILSDWISENFKYDGMMRFIDPGDYTIDIYMAFGNRDYKEILENNYMVLDNFVIDSLMRDHLKESIKCNSIIEGTISKIQTNYYESKCDSIEQFIEMDMDNSMTLKEYIKIR